MSFSSKHIHVASLTSHSPRTQTLCGSLYEQRVPSWTILCIKTTSRVSLDWQWRWQRLLAGKQTQTRKEVPSFKTNVRVAKPFLSSSFQPVCYYSLFSEWSLHESGWRSVSLCLSVWLILQLHKPPETKPGTSTQWEWTLPLHHVYYRWTLSRDLGSIGAVTLISRWQTCYCKWYNRWRRHTFFFQAEATCTETINDISPAFVRNMLWRQCREGAVQRS